MKLVIATLLAGSAAAFSPAPTSKASTALNLQFIEGTRALPFGSSPDTLDGSLPGDVGFDPIGFSAQSFSSFNNPLYEEGNFMTDLEWLREAELTHGRIAQLAVVGVLFHCRYLKLGLPGLLHWIFLVNIRSQLTNERGSSNCLTRNGKDEDERESKRAPSVEVRKQGGRGRVVVVKPSRA